MSVLGYYNYNQMDLSYFEPKIQSSNSFVILNSAYHVFALNIKLTCLNMHETSADE